MYGSVCFLRTWAIRQILCDTQRDNFLLIQDIHTLYQLGSSYQAYRTSLQNIFGLSPPCGFVSKGAVCVAEGDTSSRAMYMWC